ncbi:hypothetical protein [Microbacterium album]|uniref:Uncharacterized protein n=1 Tax=Microbacterium album TaxID=2053191 RepID=A0A917ICF4_9MICO|nr:hypothetical protein [Microbacterium album]GGH38230.1 hypothetical protein GCM10010921_08690 [Microbacterium album]
MSAPHHPDFPPQPVPGYTPPAAPYVPPRDPRYAAALQAPEPRRSAALGRIALLLALIATIGSSAALAIACGAIGAGVGDDLLSAVNPGPELLTPVRSWVLLAEIAGWAGTGLGVWALVQGIVATVQRRGRGSAIAAIVVAGIGPAVAGFAAFVGLSIGMGATAAL